MGCIGDFWTPNNVSYPDDSIPYLTAMHVLFRLLQRCRYIIGACRHWASNTFCPFAMSMREAVQQADEELLARDVHRIHITVATYGGYRYGSVPWALLMIQNTAILIRLKYGCWGNGRGPFNVIEVRNYDLKEVNYTYILMTVIRCHHKIIHIWATVRTHCTDLASAIPYHGQDFLYSLWLYCYSCICNGMVHIPTPSITGIQARVPACFHTHWSEYFYRYSRGLEFKKLMFRYSALHSLLSVSYHQYHWSCSMWYQMEAGLQWHGGCVMLVKFYGTQLSWLALQWAVFILFVGMSMAELAIAAPMSGGLYFWTHSLLSECRWRCHQSPMVASSLKPLNRLASEAFEILLQFIHFFPLSYLIHHTRPNWAMIQEQPSNCMTIPMLSLRHCASSLWYHML